MSWWTWAASGVSNIPWVSTIVTRSRPLKRPAAADVEVAERLDVHVVAVRDERHEPGNPRVVDVPDRGLVEALEARPGEAISHLDPGDRPEAGSSSRL